MGDPDRDGRRVPRRCRAMVVAVGCRERGDDGVGPAVLDALGTEPLGDVELHELRDPVRLVELAQRTDRLVLVDAVVGSPFPPGSVFQLPCRRLSPVTITPVSSHGLGVFEALQLAMQVVPASERAAISIVAVAIAHHGAAGEGLSEPVQRAIPDAVRLVRRIVGLGGTGGA